MTDLYATANLLGQLIIGRRPEWVEIPLYTDGAAVPASTKGRPYLSTSGTVIDNSPKTRVIVDLREDVARYGHRVRVATLDATATYTVTIDGLAHSYDASTGAGTEEAIIEGLADAINNGVALGSISLTFADADPDTITRAAGDWTTHSVDAGCQLIFDSDGDPNDELIVTVASRTATVVTCIATDAVTAEGPTSYAVTARRQVTAVAVERDGKWTLVINTKLGIEQSDVIGTFTDVPDADQGAELQLLDNEATVQTVTVSAGGTGVLEYDKDATTCDVNVYFTARGKNPPSGWRSPNECQFTGVTDVHFDERINSAGCTRADLEILNADGIIAGAWIGYAVQETTS